MSLYIYLSYICRVAAKAAIAWFQWAFLLCDSCLAHGVPQKGNATKLKDKQQNKKIDT